MDARGNVCLGDVVVTDGSGNIIDARGGVVAVLGVDDVVVVRSGDAVLVCSKHRTEDLKKVITALEREGHHAVL